MPHGGVGGEWRWGVEWGVGIGQSGGYCAYAGFAVVGPSPQPLSRGRGAFRALAIPGVHWMLTSRTFQ